VRVGVASEEDPANVVNQVFTARDQAAASAGAAQGFANTAADQALLAKGHADAAVAMAEMLSTSPTPGAFKVPVADAAGKLDSGWLPTINADTVDGYHAQRTPAADRIPVADETGKIDAWVNMPDLANLNYVKRDNGYNNVGSLCYAAVIGVPGNTAYASGSTHAGSSLRPACHREDSTVSPLSSSGLSGTWRCLGYVYNAVDYATQNYLTLWQRIA
jgi:hypothetical protein